MPRRSPSPEPTSDSTSDPTSDQHPDADRDRARATRRSGSEHADGPAAGFPFGTAGSLGALGALGPMLAAWMPRGDSSSPSPWTQSLRPTLNWGLQATMSWMRAAEEWQRVQLEGVHLSLHRREQVHHQMAECTDLAELAGLQAELLRFDGANAMHLTQRRYDVMLHLQTALLRAWAEWVLGGRGQWTRGLFEAMQSGLHTGFRPLDEIFNAPLQRELFGTGKPRPPATGGKAASGEQQGLNGVRHR